MLSSRQIAAGVSKAIQHFWATRQQQAKKQVEAGQLDQGSRGEATGGKQMDGFVVLVRKLIIAAGLPSSSIYSTTSLELPGYFRPEKKWDLIVVDNGILVAAIEFKSQIGPSFGNNFNNRSEEAIGTAQDIWTAYREGAFPISHRPWLGYLMMLEDCERSTTPVSVRQPHFPVFPEFIDASYCRRYQTLLTRLVRERLYDSACLVTSSRQMGPKGRYITPDAQLSFERLANAIFSHVSTYVRTKQIGH